MKGEKERERELRFGVVDMSQVKRASNTFFNREGEENGKVGQGNTNR